MTVYTLENKMKALRMAVRNAQRELVIAKGKNDTEWAEECEFIISNLHELYTTLKALVELKKSMDKVYE